jgi:hypothetical protein
MEGEGNHYFELKIILKICHEYGITSDRTTLENTIYNDHKKERNKRKRINVTIQEKRQSHLR